jgi:uncharacterized membrane protein affecting hemolysin expression
LDKRVPEYFKQLPIRLQLGIATAVLTLIASLTLVFLAARSTHYITSEQAKIVSSTLAEQLTSQINIALLNNDNLATSAILNRSVREGWIQGASVTELNGNVIAKAGNTAGSHQTLPIEIDGRILAQLRIDYSDQMAATLRSQQKWTLSGLAVIIAIAMGALAAQIGRIYSRALEALKQQIPQLEDSKDTANEIRAIETRLKALPLDLLAEQVDLDPLRPQMNQTVISLVSLDALEHYIATLNEESLERYTQRLYQCLRTAAQLYGGKIHVVRQLCVAMIFSDQDSRRATTAAVQASLLLQMLCKKQEDQGQLKYQVRCVLGQSELRPLDDHSFYADLYVQNHFDQLQHAFQQTGVLWLEDSLCEEAPFNEGYTLGPVIDGYAAIAGIPPETLDLLAEQVDQAQRKLR